MDDSVVDGDALFSERVMTASGVGFLSFPAVERECCVSCERDLDIVAPALSSCIALRVLVSSAPSASPWSDLSLPGDDTEEFAFALALEREPLVFEGATPGVG